MVIFILLAGSVILHFNNVGATSQPHVPLWIKHIAAWWAQGQISDNDFTESVQYLVQQNILQIPPPSQGQISYGNHTIPFWVKNSTGMWATGQTTDEDFVKGMQYLMQSGVLTTPQTNLLVNAQNGSQSDNVKSNGMTNSTQVVLSDNNLIAMSGNKYPDGNVELGDGKYVTAGPKKGFIYLCHVPPMGRGASGTGPWIQGSLWNFLDKPSVSGFVSWPSAFFSNTVSGDTRILSGNDLPLGNATGTFPISSSDPIYQYDQNPNSISAQSFSDKLPVNPTYSDAPYCMGGEVGIMLTGVPLFDGFDAELRDAPAHEAQDSCNGHPQNTGEYHYHSLSACFKDTNEKTVLGYALDGFPITGPQVSTGKYLTTDDLDECHGITSEINENGKSVVTYHYVMTYDFPYSASCFRGKPAQYMVINSVSNQNGPNQNGPNQNGPNQNGPNQPRSPPQVAINACSGKSSGSYCSFTSPRGDTISGTCQVPPTGSLACIPH
ncbi:MAG TPA: YHYH protein [Candidatus Nitrosotalea sp.]|nr:YHYH protein [Candidatus Nitrosotalea sp.]